MLSTGEEADSWRQGRRAGRVAGPYPNTAQILRREVGRAHHDCGVGLIKAPDQRRILAFLTSGVFVCTRGDLKSAAFEAKLEKLVHFALT